MIGRLVLADALALCADLRAMGVSGDAVAWFSGCEQLPSVALAELAAAGYRAGLTVVLSTTSAGAAASLAGAVNVLALHPVGDEAAAAELAGLASAQPGTGPLAAFSTGQAPAAAAGAGRGRSQGPGRSGRLAARHGPGAAARPATAARARLGAAGARTGAVRPLGGAGTRRASGGSGGGGGARRPAPYPVSNGADVPRPPCSARAVRSWRWS